MSKPANSAPARGAANHPFQPVRLALVLLLLAAVSLLHPQVFQLAVRGLINLEAWRHGASVEIDQVTGSFFEPVVISGSRWTYLAESGATTRVQIARAEAALVWRNLFQRTSDRWFERLAVSGVTGKFFVPIDTSAPARSRQTKLLSWRPHLGGWMPTPSIVEAEKVNFVFQSENDYVKIDDCHFTASELERGEIRAARVTLKQPWLTRTFKEIRGTTALRNSKMTLGNLALDPGVEITSLTAQLDDLAHGKLNLKLELAAFGGEMALEATTTARERGLSFESSGNFAQINIAALASFLGLSEATGGTIREGNFAFRGSPRNPLKSTARLRFEATNFQWEARQWDSLTVGLVLINGRLQVPQFELHQGQNTLSISGELAQPTGGQAWWEGEFHCNIKARIGNLTELSALLLPEFTYAAGKVEIDGQLRGRGKEFDGQLLVEGWRLTWRNAPIERLHAAVKIDGKELKVARLELANGDDYLRGSGVVNLFGPTQYWGELRAAVNDLADYAAFLQKPVLPEPLAGGAVINWTGEGSAAGHSGQFAARLRKMRTLGAAAQQLHPINVDCEASYGPGAMHFTSFWIGDDDASFVAKISLAERTVNLTGIRLQHRGKVWLEGDALLPLDVWQQWPNVAMAELLVDNVAARVKLTARELDLARASLLTGWNFPIAGIVNGTIAADGPTNALKVDGQLAIKNGQLPLNTSGDGLSEVQGAVVFSSSHAEIGKLTARHEAGELELNGTMNLTNLRDPALHFTLRSPQATLPIFQGTTPSVVLDAALDLELEGPLSAATARGEARILGLEVDAVPDLTALWDAEQRLLMPPIFSLTSWPWSQWSLDIAARPAEAEGLRSGESAIDVDVRVTGTGQRPLLEGRVELSGLALQSRTRFEGSSSELASGSGVAPDLWLEHALITFSPALPEQPSIDVAISGTSSDAIFRASAAGPLQHLIRIYEAPPSLTEEAVRHLLIGGGKLAPEEFSLQTSAPQALDAGLSRQNSVAEEVELESRTNVEAAAKLTPP